MKSPQNGCSISLINIAYLGYFYHDNFLHASNGYDIRLNIVDFFLQC